MEHHPGDPADDEARTERLRRFARALVRRHRSTIQAVAVELARRGILPGPDLDAMVPGPKPREPDPTWLALVNDEPEGDVVKLSTLARPGP